MWPPAFLTVFSAHLMALGGGGGGGSVGPLFSVNVYRTLQYYSVRMGCWGEGVHRVGVHTIMYCSVLQDQSGVGGGVG